MIRAVSHVLVAPEELERAQAGFSDFYRYENFVQSIRRISADGPCPSHLTAEEFRHIKNDFLVICSNEQNGGANSVRQFSASTVEKHKIRVGSRLLCMQGRATSGRILAENLFIASI